MISACTIVTNIFTPQYVYGEEIDNEVLMENVSNDEEAPELNIRTSISDSSAEMQEFNNSVTVGAYVAIDAKTGEILMGKNENKTMYPASLTKVLTSLLLIENKSMDDTLVVSKEATEIGEASVYVREGEVFTAKDLLYAMMLKSANDACYVVGEGVSGIGNIESFYALMNQRARQAGAMNSNFSSSNGLHQDTHYTTAYDLGLITKEAIKYPEFREAMGTQSYVLNREGDDVLKTIYHTNRMIFENKPEYNEYSLGGKTGFTTEAQNCLIEVAKKDDMEIIVVALKAAPGHIYSDTNKIINHVLDNYKSTPLLVTDESTEEINGAYLTYAPKEAVTYVTKGDSTETINSRVDMKLDEHLTGTILAGTIIGTASVYVNDGLYKTVDLVATNDIEIPKLSTFSLIRNLVLVIVVILIIKLIQVVIRHRKRKIETYMKKSNLY